MDDKWKPGEQAYIDEVYSAVVMAVLKLRPTESGEIAYVDWELALEGMCRAIAAFAASSEMVVTLRDQRVLADECREQIKRQLRGMRATIEAGGRVLDFEGIETLN